VTREIPKHNVIIIGGDINAKIGKRDATGSVLNQNTNDNGQIARLLDYAQECNLRILNIGFKKQKGKLWSKITN